MSPVDSACPVDSAEFLMPSSKAAARSPLTVVKPVREVTTDNRANVLHKFLKCTQQRASRGAEGSKRSRPQQASKGAQGSRSRPQQASMGAQGSKRSRQPSGGPVLDGQALHLFAYGRSGPGKWKMPRPQQLATVHLLLLHAIVTHMDSGAPVHG